MPNPGGPIGVGSIVTLGARVSSANRTFLEGFGAGKPAYFYLADGIGRYLAGLWTVNGDNTATITELIGLPTTETFSANCLACR